MPARRAARHAAALFGYLCIAVAFTWPLPLYLSTALPGSPGGDTGVYVWNLWVFRHEIVAHGHLPFFTREIFASPVPLALHNYTTFANVLAFPLLPWLGTVATFNVLVIGSTVASAYAMFLYARVRVGDTVSAWIAGTLFGFSPFVSARVTEHFSLVQAAPLPVFGLVLYSIWRRPTMKLAAAAGAVVAWAYLCDPYYAVYCLITTIVATISSTIIVRRRAEPWPYPQTAALLDLALLCVAGLIVGIVIRGGGRVDLFGVRLSITRLYTPMMVLSILAVIRVWMFLRPRIIWTMPKLPPVRIALAAAVACVALLSPVLYAMTTVLTNKQLLGPRVHWRSSAPGVDLLALAVPNPLHPLFGDVSRDWLSSLPNGFVENVASVPLVAIAVILYAVWRKRLRLPGPWIAYTAVFALLALGPFVRLAGHTSYIPAPWALLRYLPVIGAARMPTRFMAVVMLAVSILLAFALRHLRQNTARPNLIAAAVGVLLLFELLPAPRTLHAARVPSVFTIVADDPRPVRVLQLPFGIRDGLSSRGNFSADAQFFQTFHEKPLVGGYLSRLPDGQVERFQKIPLLRVLMRLSEGRRVEPELRARALETAAAESDRLHIGYVVVNRGRVSDELTEFAREAFGMQLVASDGEWALYNVEP